MNMTNSKTAEEAEAALKAAVAEAEGQWDWLAAIPEEDRREALISYLKDCRSDMADESNPEFDGTGHSPIPADMPLSDVLECIGGETPDWVVNLYRNQSNEPTNHVADDDSQIVDLTRLDIAQTIADNLLEDLGEGFTAEAAWNALNTAALVDYFPRLDWTDFPEGIAEAVAAIYGQSQPAPTNHVKEGSNSAG